MKPQVKTTFLFGDRVVSSTDLNIGGSMPSRPIANRIRVWP